jgi:hypothetical protein
MKYSLFMLVFIASCSNTNKLSRHTASEGVIPIDLSDVQAPYEANDPIDQSLVTAKDYCTGGQVGTNRQKYGNSFYSDYDAGVSLNITFQQEGEDRNNRIPVGYDFYAERMGGPAQLLFSDSTPEDEIEMIYPKRVYSQDYEGRGKENSFSVVDSPVREDYKGTGNKRKVYERYVSTDMRIINYAFFPRKVTPSVRKRDFRVIMTLTTGESIVLDDKSGRIISGVAIELPAKNPVEKRPANTRTFPDTDFVYQGEGIYIETRVSYNLNESRPGNLVPVRGYADGKLQECKLKSEDIWVRDYGYYLPQGHERFLSSGWQCTRYKFQTDEELYAMIRKKCPTFKFPPMVK